MTNKPFSTSKFRENKPFKKARNKQNNGSNIKRGEYTKISAYLKRETEKNCPPPHPPPPPPKKKRKKEYTCCFCSNLFNYEHSV